MTFIMYSDNYCVISIPKRKKKNRSYSNVQHLGIIKRIVS